MLCILKPKLNAMLCLKSKLNAIELERELGTELEK